MPFRSEAQKEKFQQMVKDGKMSQTTYDEWSKNTPSQLPKKIDSGSKKIKKAKVI